VNAQTRRLCDQLHRLAYRVMRLYWRTLHPLTHGALVAVWSAGEVLPGRAVIDRRRPGG
jgi:dGTP triphosphohydrolase